MTQHSSRIGDYPLAVVRPHAIISCVVSCILHDGLFKYVAAPNTIVGTAAITDISIDNAVVKGFTYICQIFFNGALIAIKFLNAGQT
mmetsp:Transcript_16360/g.22798  ORF Transcript_16360/g.22798 Transcript_16360/m.22798 type:complete len:87 (-) Transcript_16360:391-651(-)